MPLFSATEVGVPTEVSEGEKAVFARANKQLLIFLIALATVGAIVGALIAGSMGALGALAGTIIVTLFSATTLWSVQKSAGLPPVMMGAVVVGSWLGKLIALIIVLAILRNHTWYHRGVLFGVVVIGALAVAGILARAVMRGRIPFVNPKDAQFDPPIPP